MKDIELIKKFIAKYNMNKLFSEEDINYFRLSSYSKGENIINTNDEVKDIYFIISGGVDIHSFLASGRSIFINKLSPSELFGDVEYFGNIPMLFDVTANSDTKVMKISFENLEKNMGENYRLWKFLGMTSTQKLLKTNRAILLKEGFNLKNILALYLIKNNYVITFKSLNELSQELNVSYRNLTRVIKYFSDNGVIKKERKSILTLDKDIIDKHANEI